MKRTGFLSLAIWLLFASLLPGCRSPYAPNLIPASPQPSTTPTLQLPTNTLPPASLTLTSTLSAPSSTPTLTPSTTEVRSLKGDLRNQITHLEDRMPRADSQAFTIPTDAEKSAFAELIASLANGNAANAAEIALVNHYEMLLYTDRGDNDAESYLIKESKPIQKGWGLFLVRLIPRRNIIIEAPHPLADERTPLIALEIYRAIDARALLVAGAHRNANHAGSADAAHNPQTVFQSVHESLLQAAPAGWGTPVLLQIHGFAASKHLGYPQVVLGHDQGVHTDLLKGLAEALTAIGVRVGVCDGDSWGDLCGETNVQSSTMQNGVFIHIELDESIRANDDLLIQALGQTFGG